MDTTNFMPNDPFKIIDKSGDRKYFTIIPNYIVNHSTVYEQAIYLYMKRVAGEKGTCWESPINIAKKLGADPKTIRRYQKRLVERGWIEEVGTMGKTKPTIEYKVIDLWELNTRYYAEKDKGNSTLSPRKGIMPLKKKDLTPFDQVQNGNKEEPIKKIYKEETETPANAIPMSLKEFVDWCGKSNHRHIQIIGNWADTIEPDFQTKAQWEAFIKRNVRTAKNLEPFGDEKIIQGFKKIQEAVKEGWLKKYTLETLFKFIV